MPLNGNVFHSSWGPDSVARFDRRPHSSNRLNPRVPYPSAVDIIRRSEHSLFQLDASNDLHISDALWGYAIAANEDIQGRSFAFVEGRGRAGYQVFQRLLHIGIHDWSTPDDEGGGRHPSLAIRYAGVLGNALLLRIERADDQVRFLTL
jgi:hypothetical protein